MSVRGRGQTPGQIGSNPAGQRQSTRRRLAGGGSRRGGAARVSHSGDQMGGGGHLRGAGGAPLPLVVVVGPEVAGIIAGDDVSGCRSSGELGVVATTNVEARGYHLRALRGAASKVDMTARPLRGRSHAGGVHRRRRVQVSSVRCIRCMREVTERGRTEQGSRRSQQASKRARGRPELSGAAMAISADRG